MGTIFRIQTYKGQARSEEVTDMNRVFVFSALLLVFFAAGGQAIPSANKAQTEMPNVASGKKTYTEYCASCHGEDGKGMGPAASALKAPPSDLTTLAKRHAGKFPEDLCRRNRPNWQTNSSSRFFGHARMGSYLQRP
jgi:mono/diheme cytochrome c family protein